MYPEDLRYTNKHEWVRKEKNLYTVGISDFAAAQLGDVTYVELPEVGSEFAQGAEAGTVESVKAASDIYAPVAGKVAEVNGELEDRPELVNEDPYGEGWFFKVEGRGSSEFDALMDAEAYGHFVEEQEADH